MPIGIERLNARHQQPNSRITFIKPLPGPDSDFAQDFLERIAAICHPIMKANHLSITTLEEYAPNPEFVGRNFNAGEIIQLVLKAPYSGHWLSFRSVQMVMMHELAHCMQMNHSAAFWKTRNQYADELRGLWSRNYTGDGFWGKGKTLLSERYEDPRPQAPETMPRNLCGGTFRSRGRRKRKRRSGAEGPDSKSLTYAQRQQRRVAKKFGVNGVTLGDDEDTRVKLEYGVKVKAKPKVAKSVRGRELRAAAAQARFGLQKEEEESAKAEVSTENDEETEDEYEVTDGGQEEEARDVNGSRILDGQGNGMVKVCEEQDADDTHVKQEMQELQELETLRPRSSGQPLKDAPSEASASSALQMPVNEDAQTTSTPAANASQIDSAEQDKSPPSTPKASDYRGPLPSNEVSKAAITCPICSMSNEPSSITCIACSHVLDTTKVHGYWRCPNPSCSCSGTAFINADDSAFCGVCGAHR